MNKTLRLLAAVALLFIAATANVAGIQLARDANDTIALHRLLLEDRGEVRALD